jgi:hypothetical protein
MKVILYKTEKWFLQNTEFVVSVINKEYQKYYHKMYGVKG